MPESPATQAEMQKTEMQKTNDLFEDLIHRREFARLAEVYTRDARILPPGAEIIRGAESIAGFWQAAVASMNVQSVKLTSVDVHPAGDHMIEIGRAELHLPDGVVAEAKYVVEWKQEDGKWKWHTDIWNANA